MSPSYKMHGEEEEEIQRRSSARFQYPPCQVHLVHPHERHPRAHLLQPQRLCALRIVTLRVAPELLPVVLLLVRVLRFAVVDAPPVPAQQPKL